MGESFNYEEVFMGVMEGKPKTYKISLKEDYRLKRLTESLKLRKGRFLDIGCGGGVLTESLYYYFPKVKFYGCDVSKQAINYARKFGSGRVIYETIKKNKLPYKNNFFDVCICLDVMEHILDVDLFLKEVKRVLKKDGKFFLIVPCEGEPFTFTWLFQKIGYGNKLTFKNWGHIHPEFTHHSIEKLLKKHKFITIKKSYSEHLIYQLTNLILYFIPKELMTLFLGKNASSYTDRGIIKAKTKKKVSKNPIMLFRSIWFLFSKFLRMITAWELEFFKSFSLTAWKLHVLAKNDKIS